MKREEWKLFFSAFTSSIFSTSTPSYLVSLSLSFTLSKVRALASFFPSSALILGRSETFSRGLCHEERAEKSHV